MTHFNPMQAQVSDQVLVEMSTFEGKKEITGIITKWSNCIGYIKVMLHIQLDENITIWNKNDTRNGFAITVTPDNETNSPHRILA